MRVIATNTGKPTTINWKGKEVITGIFKYPTSEPIFLKKEDVLGDAVIDRKHHGGIDKACYLFSADKYDYWKQLYPNLEWNWGMFGENITIEGFDETKINIGDILKIGNVTAQVSIPREPCFKLGIRFNNQKVLKDFINIALPGTYIKILTEGKVSKNDEVTIIKKSSKKLTIQDAFKRKYPFKKFRI